MKKTIYLFCYDCDMTMRSAPEPVAAFESEEQAKEYGIKNGYIDSEKDSKLEWWQINWKIIPLEFYSLYSKF